MMLQMYPCFELYVDLVLNKCPSMTVKSKICFLVSIDINECYTSLIKTVNFNYLFEP